MDDTFQNAFDALLAETTTKWHSVSVYKTFSNVDTSGIKCSDSLANQKHINQWYDISFNKTNGFIFEETSGKKFYLSAVFIKNQCAGHMNLRFLNFNLPRIIMRDDSGELQSFDDHS